MRIHLILTAAAASLALTSAPALANQTKSSAAPAAAAASTTATKAEKKVCRRYEKPGSHASQKFCLTRAQWDKLDRDR